VERGRNKNKKQKRKKRKGKDRIKRGILRREGKKKSER
jgi:hypothetical protein